MILLSLALALTQFTALAVKDIASQAMAPFTAIQLKQRGSTPVFVIDVIQDVERFLDSSKLSQSHCELRRSISHLQRAHDANGRRCPLSALAVPAPCTSAFWSGRRPTCLATCGKPGWPSTTRCKALPGVGRASTGAMFKAPLAQESVGPNPTDREKKWEQASSLGRWPWGPVVPRRDRNQHE